MNKYRNGKIYKILDNTNNNIYIGSTIQTLENRLRIHKNLTCSSKEIIKNGDYSIILIEDYPCETDEELRKREQFYMNSGVCINNRNSYTDIKKYYKIYYKINKEKYKINKIKLDKYKISIGDIHLININLFK